MIIDQIRLKEIKDNYRSFIESCNVDNEFKLTTNSEKSPYALCFAIFGYQLLKDEKTINKNREKWIKLLLSNIKKYKENLRDDEIYFTKPYLQLLAFTLSSLKILNSIDNSEIVKHVEPIIKFDIEESLTRFGVADGIPGSGNMAMFHAILLIHLRDIIGHDVNESIDKWINFHLKSMNKFGFWGKSKNMTYLMFQNGYHQYEIFDYLKINNNFWNLAAQNINLLKDRDSRYAPYPGGGGCYDYDAIHILTSKKNQEDYIQSVTETAHSVCMSQNNDGGFSESSCIRPRNFKNLKKNLNHLYFCPSKNKYEVLKRIISIQRPIHNKIKTHWTEYSRDWYESDLWDSWFRLLLIARCDVANDPKKFSDWGFINYPGIGFHHKFQDD